jgi:mutator protein MutT
MGAVPVVRALITKDEGRTFLISKRLPGKIYGGQWEFPGGKVEPKDDTLQAAICREVKEELGIDIYPDTDYIQKRVESPHVGAVDVYYFFCQIIKGEPQRLENDGFEWVNVQALLDYDLMPGHLELAAELIEFDACGRDQY